MPSKLRKAVGALKDQTSISLAKVAASVTDGNLEVMVLRATTHEEFPVEDRHIEDILALVSSHKLHATVCAQAIGRRVSKTRSWIVALKSLMLVLRLFQDGDPFFPREVLHAMKRGAKILNLSTFRDDSNSSPWDFTAYVRTFALYLDDRLDCIITGKLQRRVNYKERQNSHPRSKKLSSRDAVCDMKPAHLLDRMSHWQKLLDRAIGTRPTGPAKSNRLIKISLYAIVRESFDLYRDISDGLVYLLDCFFKLPYTSSLSVYQACLRACKQFEELRAFYNVCKSIGVGRTSEYPSVEKMPDEVIEALQEFLKDKSSFAPNYGRPTLDSRHSRGSSSQWSFDTAESRPSLEELMSSSEAGEAVVPFSIEQYLEESKHDAQEKNNDDNSKQSTSSAPAHLGSTIDLVSFDDWPEEEETKTGQNNEQPGQQDFWSNFDGGGKGKDCWELALFESASTPPDGGAAVKSSDNNFFDQLSFRNDRSFEPSTSTVDLFAHQNVLNNNNFFEQPASSSSSRMQYNPFLDDGAEFLAITTVPANTAGTSRGLSHIFSPATAETPQLHQRFSDACFRTPTFQATPTFATDSSVATSTAFKDDLFGPCPPASSGNAFLEQRNVLFEQQLWLENQDKIIAKHLS